MKKIRHILLFIVAVAMMVSMSAMCFPAFAAEGENAAVKTGTKWSLGIEVGDVGSAATLADGPFSLASKAGALSGTVTEVNGVASIVTTEATPRRAFSKSPSGIIDITPAMTTVSQIIFTAPVAGEYYYDVSVVITSTTQRAGLWTEIGKYKDGSFNGTDPAWGYSNAAITNGTFDGWLYNTNKLDAAKTVTLEVGETIILSVEADTGDNGKTNTDETQLTVNKFDVTYLGFGESLDLTIGEAAADAKKTSEATGFSLGAMYKVGGEYVEVSLEDAARTAWGAYPGWYPVVDGVTTPYVFLRSAQGGILNMRPSSDNGDYLAVIKYTAKEAGDYFVLGSFSKASFDGRIHGREATEDTDNSFADPADADITDYLSVQKGGKVYASATMSELSTTANLSATVYLDAGESLYIVERNDYLWIGGAETVVKALNVYRFDHVCDDFDNGKCTGCEKACDHAAAEAKRTCKDEATCELCGEDLPVKADVHKTPDAFTYKPNADGKTHAKHYACCDAVAVASENHSFDATGKCTVGDCAYQCTHTAAEALRNCKDTPTCEICNVTLQTLPGTHKLDTFTYVDNDDKATHTKKYECCGEVVTATEEHDWSNKDGECAKCKAGCGHEDATVANCKEGSTCNICKKVLTVKDENNHVNPGASKIPNADGETHTEKWICCGKVVADDQAHVFGDDIVCDDCGYGCDHETWNAEYKCEACGYACPHIESTDATCVADATCKVCGMKTADKDADNHTTTETNFVDNENGTHTEKHNCCGVEIATGKHDWTNKDGKCAKCVATCDHKDAPAADCKNASVCPTCGKTVADKDASKHVGTTVVVDNKNGTHTEKYECCGTVVNATANHSYTNGKCACGAKKASSPQTSDTAMSVAVALVAIAGVGIFALNSKKRRQK